MRKKLLFILANLLALAWAGMVIPGFAQKTVIDPAMVTFADASGDAVISDGAGPYVDEEWDVSAYLADQMNLRTDDSKQDPAGRYVCLDLSRRLSTDPSLPPPPPSGSYAVYLWNNAPDVTGTTSLRSMQPGTTAAFAFYIQFHAPYNGKMVTWQLQYRFNPAGTGSPVNITRVDDRTWTVATDTTLVHSAKLVHLESGRTVNHGQFSVPFSLTMELLD